jgi:cytochrome bd-type quinol oxidase subunit 2
MKKLFKTLAIVAIFGIVAFAGSAWAQNNAGDVVALKLGNVFQQVKTVFFVLAAFGLIGMAAAALLGKIQWKWLWALVFGVAIVAGAGYIVSFAVSGGSQGGSISGITDTAFGS